jgi:adenosylcobinamide amidohydrolase
MGGVTVSLREPWLLFDLGGPHQIAGWPVVGPAWGMASSIAWLQVKDSDLPAGLSPEGYFRSRALADGISAEIGLMTAAEIARHACEQAGDVTVLATAGLSNGESVQPAKVRPGEAWHAGTINIALQIKTPLSQGAMLEALSIVAQARTAAIMDLNLTLPDGRRLTGTGTDCIIVAAPEGPQPQNHCGLHTSLGRLIGESTYKAVVSAI